jgi:phage terminase small subunit
MSEGLTDKQSAFIEHYLTCWNAAEAARKAGYSERTAREQASRLLTNVNVQTVVQERLAELKMSADEVLVRLADHARGSMAPFMRRDADGDLFGFDLGDDKPLHLLKKASITRRRQKDDRDEIVTVETVTIELYDAQAALALLGKHHKLFVDRTEITGKDSGPIEVTDARSRLAAILEKRAAAAEAERNTGAAGGSG